MSNTTNRKGKLVQVIATTGAVAGLAGGMCPVSREKETKHVDVQQEQPVTPVGNAAISYVATGPSATHLMTGMFGVQGMPAGPGTLTLK